MKDALKGVTYRLGGDLCCVGLCAIWTVKKGHGEEGRRAPVKGNAFDFTLHFVLMIDALHSSGQA